MRLSKDQVESLIRITHQSFGSDAKIWLFGSRVDDSKKGGDIDVYIETDKETGVIAAKLEMMCLLESAFGEQKIDVLVRRRNQEPSPMHEIAKSSGVELL